MRGLGNILFALGLGVGAAVSAGILLHLHVGLPILIAVGIAKLLVITSLGLMAGGAVLHRLARREEERKRELEGP